MKKFLSVILILCLIVCGGIFAGCGANEIVLDGGPAYDDAVYGNGGFIVTKGDYVYFTDAYTSSSSLGSTITNKQGTVGETGLYRAKIETEDHEGIIVKTLTNVELMVSKVVGFENSGLFIFKDKIYFASPTIDSDKSGVRYDLITFFSCNLDGSNIQKVYQTTKFENGSFSMTMIDEKVYLLVYTGNEIVCVAENGKATTLATDVTGAILPLRENVSNISENPASVECFVYYTVDKEEKGSVDQGNTLYKVDIKNGNKTTLLDEERVEVNLSELKDGKLYYSRNEVIGSTSIYGVYSNSLQENFKSGETKIISGSNEVSILGSTFGVAYVNSNDKLIAPSLSSNAIKTDVKSVIFAYGNYIYYINTDSDIYRQNLTDLSEDAEKLNGSLTVKTDYFDIDENYFYFFVSDTATDENGSQIKTTGTTTYMVELASTDKTPVVMA